MPIYEYRCEQCGSEQELISRFSDPNPTCTQCGQEMIKKISLSSFHLKGSGWYVTDYKSGKSEKKESSTQEGKTSGESGSSVPTDL